MGPPIPSPLHSSPPISSHPISSHLISSPLISSHPISSRLRCEPLGKGLGQALATDTRVAPDADAALDTIADAIRTKAFGDVPWEVRHRPRDVT
jgi:hypothetical protein